MVVRTQAAKKRQVHLLTVSSLSDRTHNRPAVRLCESGANSPNAATQTNETPPSSPALTPTKRDFLQDLAAAESKDDAKAKRAPSGWLLFCAEMRAYGDCGTPRAGKRLCDRWREMDDAEKKRWNDKAAIIKDAMKRGEAIPPYAQRWRRPAPWLSEAHIVAREAEVWRNMAFWQAKAAEAESVAKAVADHAAAIAKGGIP
jgi:hypothetical protein